MSNREIMQAIADLARAIFQAQAASVAVLDGEGFRFEAASGRGDWIVGARFSAGEGLAGAVAASGEARVVEDLEADPSFARDLAERLGYVPHTMMVAPLKVDGEVRGVLSVLDCGDATRGIELLGAFTTLAALAL